MISRSLSPIAWSCRSRPFSALILISSARCDVRRIATCAVRATVVKRAFFRIMARVVVKRLFCQGWTINQLEYRDMRADRAICPSELSVPAGREMSFPRPAVVRTAHIDVLQQEPDPASADLFGIVPACLGHAVIADHLVAHGAYSAGPHTSWAPVRTHRPIRVSHHLLVARGGVAHAWYLL